MIPLDQFQKFGSIEPVLDTNPQVVEYPTIGEIKSLMGEVGLGEVGLGEIGTGDAINVGVSDALPAPDTFVPCEELPTLLRIEAPVYPPLAREANVEGTVLLRVLVSKEGKVLNAIALSGNPMLIEAARTAAFTAQFRPALQQHKPVPVWVQLPIVFSLN
jgi:TonB family protein